MFRVFEVRYFGVHSKTTPESITKYNFGLTVNIPHAPSLKYLGMYNRIRLHMHRKN